MKKPTTLERKYVNSAQNQLLNLLTPENSMDAQLRLLGQLVYLGTVIAGGTVMWLLYITGISKKVRTWLEKYIDFSGNQPTF